MTGWRVRGFLAISCLWSAILCAVPAQAYVLGPGDVLSIVVWQRDDLATTAAVDPEGNVSLPLVGAIRAQGLTPEAFGAELTRRFSFVDRGVSQITVSVLEYHAQKVHVLGQVANPGAYGFAEIPGVWEVIRDAGGPTAAAAISRVRVIPGDGRPATVIDLEEILELGSFEDLPALSSGATIFVPQAVAAAQADQVHVYGSVAAPGSFSIDAAGNVLQAVLAAGGPLENANMGKVRVVRPGPVQAQVFEVDLGAYLKDGTMFPNLPLKPGDTVAVSDNQTKALLRSIRDAAFGTGSLLLGALVYLAEEDENNSTVTVETSGGSE